MIAGPVGRLEALLEEPEGGAPRQAAVVCHPHPLHGGTMHNKVVYRVSRGLRSTGSVVLRFNFRGVNMSEGSYAKGTGEIEDARAALAWLRERYPDLPYTLAGFSFGSRVILRLGCSSAGADRLIAVGYPTAYRDFDVLESCTVSKIFVQSTHDQHGPRPDIEALVARLPEPKRLIFIEAADHFFDGALDQLEETIKSL